MATQKGGTPVALPEILARWWQDQVVVKTRPDGSFFSASGAPLTPEEYRQGIVDELAPHKLAVNGWPDIDADNPVVSAMLDAEESKYAAERAKWAVVVFNNTLAPWQVDVRKELGIPADLGIDKDA